MSDFTLEQQELITEAITKAITTYHKMTVLPLETKLKNIESELYRIRRFASVPPSSGGPY